MEHRMILMDADFKTVRKMIVARRKNAGMAEEAMHLLRNEDYPGSTPGSCSTFDEPIERLAEID